VSSARDSKSSTACGIPRLALASCNKAASGSAPRPQAATALATAIAALVNRILRIIRIVPPWDPEWVSWQAIAEAMPAGLPSERPF
jgi:hypothetical protein